MGLFSILAIIIVFYLIAHFDMGLLIVIAIIIVFYLIAHWDDESKTREKIYDVLKQNRDFTSMKTLAMRADKEVHLDTNSKKIAIIDKNNSDISVDYIPFSSVVECEILESNISIAKGSISRAVIGGAIAGGVGAVVGSVSAKSSNYSESLAVRIVTNNLNSPLFVINYFSSKQKKDSSLYKNAFSDAQNLYATLTSIIKSNESLLSTSLNQQNAEQNSLSEQISALSKLHDEGILTDSEFESKKNQILSHM